MEFWLSPKLEISHLLRPFFLSLTTAMVTDTLKIFNKIFLWLLCIAYHPSSMYLVVPNISLTSTWLYSLTSFRPTGGHKIALVLEEKRAKGSKDWRAICTTVRSFHLLKLTVKCGKKKKAFLQGVVAVETIKTHEENLWRLQYSGKVLQKNLKFSLWIYLHSDPCWGIHHLGMGSSLPSEMK